MTPRLAIAIAFAVAAFVAVVVSIAKNPPPCEPGAAAGNVILAGCPSK